MPPLKESRKDKLAINLFDLDELVSPLRMYVVGDRVDYSKPIRVGESISETAVPFSCGLLAAATACDVLQSELRKAKLQPVRIYSAKEDGSWRSMPAGTLYTVLHDDLVALNPEVFGKQVAKRDVPVEAERLF